MPASTSNLQLPILNLPESGSICQLSIINTTCNITAPSNYLVEPFIKGHEWLNLPTYAFHIKHDASGRELVFDLGSRKDWQNNVPSVADVISEHVPGLKVDKDITEILKDGGIVMDSIEAVILSHWHFDHCGDMAALPKSVKLLVGPGFKKAFLPGWPANEKSPFHEAYFEGRETIEIPFFSDVKIGGFEARDYFGDGSLYILNVPGHATAHICALVRTTGNTFVFLGGDSCHFGGALRPSAYVRLPDMLPVATPLDERLASPCPCSIFTPSHPDQDNCRESPFYKISAGSATWYDDPKTSQKSVEWLQEFDAHPNVLVAISHDATALKVCDFFPGGTMNDWERKGWKEALHWGFLNEFSFKGKGEQYKLVDGLYKDGKKIKNLLD